MKLLIICVVLSTVLATSRHSHTDICYRFDEEGNAQMQRAYQIYTNKRGELLSSDHIINQGVEYNYDVSYYYHYVLSDCEPVSEGMKCTQTCESVWFKFLRLDGHYSSYIPLCDEIFQKKYGNVMEYDCPGSELFLKLLKEAVGQVETKTIKMVGGKPIAPQASYKVIGECVWEYDILGLLSIVALSIIGSIGAVAIIILLLLIAFVQKHRENKRKRLEGNLLKQNQEGEMPATV